MILQHTGGDRERKSHTNTALARIWDLSLLVIARVSMTRPIPNEHAVFGFGVVLLPSKNEFVTNAILKIINSRLIHEQQETFPYQYCFIIVLFVYEWASVRTFIFSVLGECLTYTIRIRGGSNHWSELASVHASK
jgi:hypothetical protein